MVLRRKNPHDHCLGGVAERSSAAVLKNDSGRCGGVDMPRVLATRSQTGSRGTAPRAHAVVLQARLADLRRRIERDFGASGVFFFPAVREVGIAGYSGTGPTVFVAERPSRPPKKRRQATKAFANRLYELLKQYRFEGAHLTDLIKHYPGTGLGYKRVIDLNWPYFLEELSIVDAKLVVAVGSAVRDELRRRQLPYPMLDVPHYSYRYGSVAVLRSRLDEAFRRVRAAADALGPKD